MSRLSELESAFIKADDIVNAQGVGEKERKIAQEDAQAFATEIKSFG